VASSEALDGEVRVVAVARPLDDPHSLHGRGWLAPGRPARSYGVWMDETTRPPRRTQRSAAVINGFVRRARPARATARRRFPTRFLASSFFSGSRAVRRPPPSVTVSHPTAAGWPPPRDSQSHMRSLISHHTNRQPPLPYAAMFPRYSTKSRSPQVWYVMISMPTNHLTEWFIC
jgi:hypothetical protein